METSLFISALSKTLPESCLQGLLAYLALQLLFALFKKSTPTMRFNFYYLATLLLFWGFLFTFFTHYQESKHTVFTSAFLSDTSVTNPIIAASKPNLWSRLSYFTSHYAYMISGLYLIGLIFCVLRLILGLINIRWFKNSGQLQLEKRLTEQVKKLSLNFNLVKTVSVFLSEKIQVPLTVGFVKPIIVFPIALINQLSTEQTEAILLHELAHIKRADYLWNIILGIIQSFLFFNPIVWLMIREINKYREQCCDDLVLDKTQHQLAYACALLLIEENRSTSLNLALASNGKKYNLLNRIKRITNMKINEPSPQNKLVVLLLAFIVICISVAWNMPVKEALKSRILRHVKITETKFDKSTSSWSSNQIALVRSKPNTSQIKIISDKMVFQPNNKTGKKFTITGKKMIFDFNADTVIKSKNKFKIVLEDSTGNKKEYNSIEELPKDAQKEFLKENQKTYNLMNYNFNSVPMTNFKLLNRLNDTVFLSSTEWKKQAAEMRKQGLEMRKQSNSPELKKLMEDMRKQSNSPELKKLMEDMKTQNEDLREQFNGPEWKKQMEDIQLQSKQMSKQGEEMRKYYQSPEWKKQQKKVQKEIEKSRKEWKNSKDFQPHPMIPKKPNQPEQL